MLNLYEVHRSVINFQYIPSLLFFAYVCDGALINELFRMLTTYTCGSMHIIYISMKSSLVVSLLWARLTSINTDIFLFLQNLGSSLTYQLTLECLLNVKPLNIDLLNCGLLANFRGLSSTLMQCCDNYLSILKDN